MINPFFKNTGPHDINYLLKTINLKNESLSEDKIIDIKDLNSSKKNEITFLHSKKYTDLAKKTKASYCLTSYNFKSFLPKNCKAIITDKVLLHTAQITKIFYPDSITDDYAGGPSTTGSLIVGSTISGQLETLNDSDWFAITLESGVAYQLTATDDSNNNGLQLGLSDINGDELYQESSYFFENNYTESYESGTYNFIPTTSGDYFLSVRSDTSTTTEIAAFSGAFIFTFGFGF